MATWHDLPPELRIMIYREVIQLDHDTSLPWNSECSDELAIRIDEQTNFSRFHHLKLLQISQSISAESQPLLARSIFVFDDLTRLSDYGRLLAACKCSDLVRSVGIDYDCLAKELSVRWRRQRDFSWVECFAELHRRIVTAFPGLTKLGFELPSRRKVDIVL